MSESAPVIGEDGTPRWRWTPRVEELDLGRVRRSRYVGILKVALPLLAAAILVVLLAWPQVFKRDEGFRLSFASVDRVDSALVMLNPRYRGTTAKNEPYLVTAESGTQDPRDPRFITLDRPNGDINLANGDWLSLSANTGIYQQEAETLDLRGDISIYSGAGYEFHATTAQVDLNTGTVSSDQPVWGQGPLGLLNANGMRAYEHERRIRFINGVHTTLFPGAAG